MSEIKLIELSKIVSNKYRVINEEELSSLTTSIEKNGLVEPILVKEVDGMYEVISGEKRLNAVKTLNRNEIEAIVIDGDESDIAEVALMGNSRNTISAIEEALEMQKMVKAGATQAQVARNLGLKQSTVANKLRLLKLPAYVQEAVVAKKITERHARALLKVEPEELEKVFNVIIERGYNVKQTEEYLNALRNKGKERIRGVTSNVKLGINTIKGSYDLCRRSGLDADYKVTEYDNEVKIVIRFKK